MFILEGSLEMDIHRHLRRESGASSCSQIAAAILTASVLMVSGGLLAQGSLAQVDNPAASTLNAQGAWEVVNIGNGYFQIRLQLAEDGKRKCLTSVPRQTGVMLADCEPQRVESSIVREWSFNRLTAGGYQVVSRWADFYGYPACLAVYSRTPVLESCGQGEGRERTLQGIAKLYADPTEL
jgi:hypothetical protein